MTSTERMKMLLSEKNLKQNDLAHKIGVSASTLNNWIKRNSDLPARYIIPICEFLGVSVYCLLLGEDRKDDFVMNNSNSLIERYNLLDSDGQDMVRATLINEMRRMEQQKPLEVSIAQGGGEPTSSPRETMVSTPTDKDTAMNGPKAQPNHYNGGKKNA